MRINAHVLRNNERGRKMLNSDNLIRVTRSSMPTLEEYVEEIRPIFETHWLTNVGPKHRELEKQLASFLGVRQVSLFVNGHSALEYILEAMELGGEVITTPFSFVSTANAIRRKGLKPVFADIKRSDYTLDPTCIEPLITENTCAIMPVHVYGNLCDVDAIQAIADKYSLKVIYDAAHAFDVSKDGVGAAAFGDASMFSFHATKVFNTIEGGCVATDDDELYERLVFWKNFGITGSESVEYVGGNAKMNEFAAAMGLCNLRHVHDEIGKRRIVAERYYELLQDVEGLVLRKDQPGVAWNYAYFPVCFEDSFGATRDEVFERLKTEGIFTRKYFYPLITNTACYRDEFDSSKTPIANDVARRILTLPMYADLPLADIERICSTVISCR